MEIAEFLLARIAEREAAARKAKPGPWTYDGGLYAGHPTNEVVDWVYDESAEHIALNDPTFILAKCAADRRIVELTTGPIYRLVERVANEWGGSVGTDTDADEDLLRALALPYADHPDYDPEWKV